MILAIDVGNTNITVGVFAGDALRESWRLHTDLGKTGDEYGAQMLAMFTNAGLDMRACSGVIISSVVPPLQRAVQELCQRYLRQEPLWVDPQRIPGTRVLIERPHEVGTDRVVNTVAAHALYGGPCLVVDFGTGTTFDVVSAEGDYLGGAIAPGIGIAAEALVSRASRLFRVEFVPPPSVLGKNTVHALQAGIVLGYFSLVEGMIARFKRELGEMQVIATGGLAPLFAGHVPTIQKVDMNLTLEGLRIIYSRLQKGR
jgi:type III pantothenate kinase